MIKDSLPLVLNADILPLFLTSYDSMYGLYFRYDIQIETVLSKTVLSAIYHLREEET